MTTFDAEIIRRLIAAGRSGSPRTSGQEIVAARRDERTSSRPGISPTPTGLPRLRRRRDVGGQPQFRPDFDHLFSNVAGDGECDRP